MKIIENNKVRESLYAQCSVVLEARAYSLTQGCYKDGVIEGRFTCRC